MPIVTKAEFARQAGVSRPAVAYALKHGKLIQTDGKIDTDISENRYYLARNQGTKTPKNSTPFAKRKAGGEAARQPARVINGDYDEDLSGITLEEAAKLEKLERIMKLRVETASRRGELLDKEDVKIAFMKFYAVHTGELHPLGDKISQDLAAVFEDDDETRVTQAREVVDKHVFKTLGHIKRLLNDFCQEQMDEKVIKDE